MPMSQQGTRNSRRAPGEKDFTKRRTVDEGLALSDAAHAAVWRLYCEVFKFWRSCRGAWRRRRTWNGGCAASRCRW